MCFKTLEKNAEEDEEESRRRLSLSLSLSHLGPTCNRLLAASVYRHGLYQIFDLSLLRFVRRMLWLHISMPFISLYLEIKLYLIPPLYILKFQIKLSNYIVLRFY